MNFKEWLVTAKAVDKTGKSRGIMDPEATYHWEARRLYDLGVNPYDVECVYDLAWRLLQLDISARGVVYSNRLKAGFTPDEALTFTHNYVKSCTPSILNNLQKNLTLMVILYAHNRKQ